MFASKLDKHLIVLFLAGFIGGSEVFPQILHLVLHMGISQTYSSVKDLCDIVRFALGCDIFDVLAQVDHISDVDVVHSVVEDLPDLSVRARK